MIDPKLLRDNPKLVEKAAKAKGVKVDIKEVLETDERRRKIIQELDALRAEQNEKSKEKVDESARDALRGLKEKIKTLEGELAIAEKEFTELAYQIPNLPADDVPVGTDESENQVIRQWGDVPKFDFTPLDHLEIGQALDLVDVERAAKISGSRFAYLKNEAVVLEFALVRFALDVLTKEGFVPIVPPVLIRRDITPELGYWQGSPPAGGEDYYSTEEFYLVGTAEHSVVPIHKDEILDVKDLPRRYAAFSTCFRREAGSYGKDTQGIMRVHQFDKVEMVSFVPAEQDDAEHEFLLSLEEKLFQALKIPYRVVKMCTADLGFPIARKYDIEAWMPGQDTYREVTSASTTTDFQARRLNIRYRQGDKKHFAHILNGTAFAIGRTLVAIIENYQTKEGKVLIPEVLRKYMGKDEIS